jgi:outer membrane protein TolC
MRTLLLSYCLIATTLLNAQEPQRMSLSMKQAVDLALTPQGAARVQLAREMIQASQTRVVQSRASLLPNLDAAITEQNFTRNLKAFGVQIPIPGYPDVVGPISTFDARGTLSQTIFDFSAYTRVRAAKAQVETAKAEEDAARNAVSDTVARAYLALVRAGEAVDTAQANVSLSQSLLDLANSQKDAGTGTGIEVTRAQVQLANDKQRVLIATNDRSQAEIQLLRAIGLNLSAHIDATDKLQFTPPEDVTLQVAIDTAGTTRADLKVQQRRETVMKMQLDAVKWERLPSVAGFADAGGIGLNPGDVRYTRTFGVSLRIPVWDGGRRDARRAESASLYRQEQIRARDLKLQVEAEVRVAFEDLQSAAGQVAVAEQGVQLADAELAQARRRYQAGVGASIEVTDAQTRVARARDNRTAALFLHNLAKIELASAMGVIHKVIQ